MQQLTSAADPVLWPGNDWNIFLREISSHQHTPLMLYKAFFAEKYDLFARVGCTPVVSPQNSHYPPANCSERFFAALFLAFAQAATPVGQPGDQQTAFQAFETDFISDHLLQTQGLTSDANGLKRYFAGMGSAAATAGVAVQLCMPTAGVVLASAHWPAMTNGRVSTDYGTPFPGTHAIEVV